MVQTLIPLSIRGAGVWSEQLTKYKGVNMIQLKANKRVEGLLRREFSYSVDI